MTDKPRPPNDRGQGRKTILPSGEIMKGRPVRMSDAQWAKCIRLGGAAWLRDRIDKAMEPGSADVVNVRLPTGGFGPTRK